MSCVLSWETAENQENEQIMGGACYQELPSVTHPQQQACSSTIPSLTSHLLWPWAARSLKLVRLSFGTSSVRGVRGAVLLLDGI